MEPTGTLKVEMLLAKIRKNEAAKQKRSEKTEMPAIGRRPARQQGGNRQTERYEFRQGAFGSQALNERFYKAFLLNPSLMCIVTVPDLVHLDVNEAYAQALGSGRQEIIGCSVKIKNFFPCRATGMQIVKLLLKTGEITNYEVPYWHNLQGQRYALLNAELVADEGKPCVFITLNDITERKYLENELGRFDRLNLVGQLAAAIGHEVRNPMTAVRGFLQIFSQKAELKNYHEHFGIMLDELDRANSILTEFLSLTKDKSSEMQQADLNKVIAAIFPLLQADAFHLGHHITIETGDIPEFEFDEKEMRQLIFNLVRNGLEAMEQPGTVRIKTYTVNGCPVLAVKDTGSGISPAILDKLGTPFLTTKGTGTGLGLPVCYRVAERHGAHIEVKSGPGGTLFTVTFTSKRCSAELN